MATLKEHLLIQLNALFYAISGFKTYVPPFLLTIRHQIHNIIITCYQRILTHKYVKYMSKLTKTIKQTLISVSKISDKIVYLILFYVVVKSHLSLAELNNYNVYV